MRRLALFDLDHTLLPLDSDYEWGRFLCRKGAVDVAEFQRRNDVFFHQYQAGTLDPYEYLEFALGNLARFPRAELDVLHQEFMAEVVQPAILPVALDLLDKHHQAGDDVAIVTATNRYVTAPIAKALGVQHLLAAEPEQDAVGNITGKLVGVPSNGEGKIHHVQNWLQQRQQKLDDFHSVHFYSDSHNDLPLMELVSHPVATNPNQRLRAHAEAKGWPVLELFKHD